MWPATGKALESHGLYGDAWTSFWLDQVGDQADPDIERQFG
ncbi:MAG: hypothetical protein WBL50_10295 [Candidatus Acidiferrum sp.]